MNQAETSIHSVEQASRYDAAVEREYKWLAPQYDKRWAYYIQASHRETLRRCDFPPAAQILDVGCGTGSLFLEILSKFPSVRLVGLDLSSAMLEIARRKLKERVSLVVGQADRLPLRSEYFDAVISCNSFHYWPKPEDGLREISRVLKSGGEIVLTDWCYNYWACRAADFILRFVSCAHYKTYRSSALARLFREAGFTSVNVEPYKIDWFWGLMTATGNKA